MVSNVCHCLPEYTIIHDFEEVLLKFTLCVFSSFDVEIYILLEPATWVNSMTRCILVIRISNLTYSCKFLVYYDFFLFLRLQVSVLVGTILTANFLASSLVYKNRSFSKMVTFSGHKG